MVRYCLLFLFLCAGVIAARSQNHVATTPVLLIRQIGKTRPDTNRIKLQLQIAKYYVQKLGYFKIDKDSALVWFNQAYSLSVALHSMKWEREILMLKGDCYIQIDDYENGALFYNQVIQYNHNANDKKSEAQAWERFGDSFSRSPDLQYRKINCYLQAGLLYKETGNRLSEIQIQKKIADVHMVEGKYDLAERELLRVAEELKSINFRNLHYTYDLLASVNRMKGNLHQELFYKLKVVNSMESTRDFKLATYFYYNLATTYFDLGLYDKSLSYYNKALPYSIEEQNYDRYYELLRDIVKVLILQKKSKQALRFLQNKTKAIPPKSFKQRDWMDAAFGNCYENLKAFDKAESYYLDMAALSEIDYRNKDYEDYLKNYSIISNFYVVTKQYGKADPYLRKLQNAPPNLLRPSAMSQVQLMQFKVDSASGRWASAIRHYQQHKRLNDSLFNATNKKLLDEVQLRYESERKDKDLQLQAKNILLLKKQAQLEQNQADRAGAIKNVFIGGTLMLLVLFALGYNRYRLKQLSNLQLQENQKLITDKNNTLEKLLRDNEWLLKEVHHRVKNNMQIIASLLSSQSMHLKDKVALNAVRDSRHRIQTMALIHQKLYSTENVSVIFMPEYINELVEYLKDSFKTRKTIFFDQDIDPVSLDVLQVVPIGLILNEAITNAIKYAFPYAQEDRLLIRLTVLDKNDLALVICDNGRGLPDLFDIDKPASFGMKLMKGLTEELGGSFTIKSNNGTIVSIIFSRLPSHR